MSKIIAMPGVTPTPGAEAPNPVPRNPHPATVEYLETLLAQARAGDVVGVAVVPLWYDRSASYSIVGTVGGYSMQGALACVQQHMAMLNMGMDDDDEDASGT
jgi:DNA-binding transcriptional LysR family regulator